VKIPGDLTDYFIGAAVWLEFADVAIQFAGAIESCTLGRDAASRGCVRASKLEKLFVRRARVAVAFGIEGKVRAGGNVPSVRLDLSNTRICGAIPFRLTSQARLSAEP
jgi:hypothetical protein